MSARTRVPSRLSSTASFLPDLHPCGSTLYSHVGGAEPLRLRTRDFSVSPARKKDSHTQLYRRARHGTTQAHNNTCTQSSVALKHARNGHALCDTKHYTALAQQSPSKTSAWCAQTSCAPAILVTLLQCPSRSRGVLRLLLWRFPLLFLRLCYDWTFIVQYLRILASPCQVQHWVLHGCCHTFNASCTRLLRSQLDGCRASVCRNGKDCASVFARVLLISVQ